MQDYYAGSLARCAGAYRHAVMHADGSTVDQFKTRGGAVRAARELNTGRAVVTHGTIGCRVQPIAR